MFVSLLAKNITENRKITCRPHRHGRLERSLLWTCVPPPTSGPSCSCWDVAGARLTVCEQPRACRSILPLREQLERLADQRHLGSVNKRTHTSH